MVRSCSARFPPTEARNRSHAGETEPAPIIPSLFSNRVPNTIAIPAALLQASWEGGGDRRDSLFWAGVSVVLALNLHLGQRFLTAWNRPWTALLMKPMQRPLLPPLPVAPKLLLALGGVAVYGLIANLVFSHLRFPLSDLGQGITILNGIVLGVLLVFRNNTAYDRWWEGRKLWGQVDQ